MVVVVEEEEEEEKSFSRFEIGGSGNGKNMMGIGRLGGAVGVIDIEDIPRMMKRRRRRSMVMKPTTNMKEV